MLNVGEGSIIRAKKVLADAIPQIQDMVESGEISVNAASAVAALPKEAQTKAARGGVDGVKQAAKAAKQAPASEPTPAPHASGLGIAATAISVLGRILPSDIQREEAFNKVIAYCQKQLSETK